MKLFKIIIIIFISLTSSIKADSQKKLINELKEGGKVIFIRHAYAPGNGDPKNFNKKDCSTQRNLNEQGIEQSKKIGQFFTRNQIIFNKIFSSEWCRCKDTAKYAFNEFITFDALNSFYQAKFLKNKDRQIAELKKFIDDYNGNQNIVFVSHYVVIAELLNVGVKSGEIIISNKDFKVIDTIEIEY